MFLSFHLNFEFILKTWIHLEFRGPQKPAENTISWPVCPKTPTWKTFTISTNSNARFQRYSEGGQIMSFLGNLEFKLNSSWIQNNTISWPGFPKTPSNSSFTISANSNARFRRFSEGGSGYAVLAKILIQFWIQDEFKMATYCTSLFKKNTISQ